MKCRVIIIGAGITGLALGWFLRQRHGEKIDVTIFESADRPGGWIRSLFHDGFLFEMGPRSCRSRGAGIETLRLVEALGIEQEVITAAPAAKQRYLYVDGKLQKIPRDFWSSLTSPLMKGAISALWKELWAPRGTLPDESIAEFFERRVGKALTGRFIDPLVSGIYAGDINRLSMQACFPDMFARERTAGSLVAGMARRQRKHLTCESAFIQKMRKEPLFSFRNGMETLVKALAMRLQGDIKLSQPVASIAVHPEAVQVATKAGKTFAADYVFLTLPSKRAAELLAPLDDNLSSLVNRIPRATVASVNMGWKRDILLKKGFGYLIPSQERQKILGVVWDSSAFPQHRGSPEHTRLTVMMGGTKQPEVASLSQRAIEQRAVDAIAFQMGISILPDSIITTIAAEAIPQYEVGHKQLVEEIEGRLAGISASRLILAGSTWHGASVNDCIAHAKQKVYDVDMK